MNAIIILGYRANKPAEPEPVYIGCDGVAAQAAADEAAKERTYYGGKIQRVVNPQNAASLPVVYAPIVFPKVVHHTGKPDEVKRPTGAETDAKNQQLFEQRAAEAKKDAEITTAQSQAEADTHSYTLSLLQKNKTQLIEAGKLLGLTLDNTLKNSELIAAILDARQNQPKTENKTENEKS